MGATFKAVLHPSLRRDGTQQVRIRITAARVSRFWDQGVTVRAKDWNDKAGLDKPHWLRAGHTDASFLNTHLRNALGRARELALTHPTWSAQQLLQELVSPALPEGELCVHAFLTRFIPLHTASLAPRTRDGWWRLHRAISAWRKGGPWPLSEFTPLALQELHHYLLTRPGGGQVGATQRLWQLKAVATALVHEGKLDLHRNPFLKIRFALPAAGTPRVLHLREQTHLLRVELPAGHRGKRMGLARDIFQAQFLLWGTRLGDVLELTWGQVGQGEVLVRERKTGKEKRVEILPALAELLARYYPRTYTPAPTDYVFPVLERFDARTAHAPGGSEDSLLRAISRGTKRVNGYLRALALHAGVEPFTSHAARHSFATTADATLGNLRQIQQLLNHSSPHTTEKYLARLSNRDVQDAGSRVLSAWNIGTTPEQQNRLTESHCTDVSQGKIENGTQEGVL